MVTFNTQRSLICPVMLAMVLWAGASRTFATETPSIEPEHTQLALMLRQLQMLDRLIATSEASSELERSRYRFSYPRLRSDVERIRIGIQTYLAPERPQLREWPEPDGGYRLDRDVVP